MDFYDQGVDYSSAVERIKKEQDELQRKSKKTMTYINAFLLSVLVFSLTWMVLDNVSLPFYLIPIGMVSLTILIVYWISTSSVKSRLINETVNKEILSLYNMEKGTFLEYQYKVKLKNQFNKEMGLFTRFSSVGTKYYIKGMSSNHHNIEVIKCTLTTSDGKNTHIHFDGIYVTFDVKTWKTFQIRTKGKPALKGIKFSKTEGNSYNEFVPLEEPNGIIDSKYINLFEKVSSRISSVKTYLGSNNEQIHLAFTPVEPKNYSNEYTVEDFKKNYQHLESILNLVLEIAEDLDEA